MIACTVRPVRKKIAFWGLLLRLANLQGKAARHFVGTRRLLRAINVLLVLQLAVGQASLDVEKLLLCQVDG